MTSYNEEAKTIILSLNELEAYLLHKCITFTMNHKKTNVDAPTKKILDDLSSRLQLR